MRSSLRTGFLKRQNSTENPKEKDIDESVGTEKAQDEISSDSERSAAEEEYVSLMARMRLKCGCFETCDAPSAGDLYVKFKYKGKTFFKSSVVHKSSNPVWNEECAMIICDPTTPIIVNVFEYGRFAADDLVGNVEIDMSLLPLFKNSEMKLAFMNKDGGEARGHLNVDVNLSALTPSQRDERMIAHCERSILSVDSEFLRRYCRSTYQHQPKLVDVIDMTRTRDSVLNIILVGGRNLSGSSNTSNLPDPAVKFKLDAQKYKSKPASRTQNPMWLEQLNLNIYSDSEKLLDVSVIDRRSCQLLGRCSIDLNEFEAETPSEHNFKLDPNGGSIFLLISKSATICSSSAELSSEIIDDHNRLRLAKKYGLLRTFINLSDVGCVAIKVHQARELSIKDVNSKNVYTIIELVNAHLRTQSVPFSKTEWNTIFFLPVRDIHELLEVTLRADGPNSKSGFIGKVEIPLLKIRNNDKRWYKLRDKVSSAVKGELLLEMHLKWNQTYILFVYYIKLEFIPIVLIIFFLSPSLTKKSEMNLELPAEDTTLIQQELPNSEKGSNSLMEILHAPQSKLRTIQDSADFLASLLERIKNTFNFTEPYLSCLAIVVLIFASIILYFVPPKSLLIVLGTHKFSKKLRNQNYISNNELLDFLSRVPSDSEARAFSESLCGEE